MRRSARRILWGGGGAVLGLMLALGCDGGPPGPNINTVVTSLTVVASPAAGGTVEIFRDPIQIDGNTRMSYGTHDYDVCQPEDDVDWFLEATAATGYEFDHWGPPCSSEVSDNYVMLPCNGMSNTCTAYFVPLATTPADAGTPKDGGSSVAAGPTLSLQGPWSLVQDANQNTPAPQMEVNGSSPQEVTVTYDGEDGSACDCNAEHLSIPLGKTIQCSAGTLEFDYHTSGFFGMTSTASLSVRFCTGPCSESGFYGGQQFLGSEQTGHSNCAIPFSNSFPAAPQLVEGHNKIKLSSLSSSLNGSCGGSFDTVDVHMQGYGCFASTDTATSTLANLQVY